MLMSQRDPKTYQDITPPPRSPNRPLTPPSTVEKPTGEARRVIALFKHIQAGGDTKGETWVEFQLNEEDFDQVQRLLQQDRELLGCVDDKIR